MIKCLRGENDVKKIIDAIEVRIEEVKKDIKGKNYEVTQVIYRKKMIGEIFSLWTKRI